MNIKSIVLTTVCTLSLLLPGCSGDSTPTATTTPAATPVATGAPAAAEPAKMLMGGADIESVTVSENFDTVNNPRLEAGGYVGSIKKDEWKQHGPGQADQPMSFGRGYSRKSVSEFEASSLTIKFKDGREVVVNLPAYTIAMDGTWTSGDMTLDKKMYIGEDGKVYADAEGTKLIPVAPAAEATPSPAPTAGE